MLVVRGDESLSFMMFAIEDTLGQNILSVHPWAANSGKEQCCHRRN